MCILPPSVRCVYRAQPVVRSFNISTWKIANWPCKIENVHFAFMEYDFYDELLVWFVLQQNPDQRVDFRCMESLWLLFIYLLYRDVINSLNWTELTDACRGTLWFRRHVQKNIWTDSSCSNGEVLIWRSEVQTPTLLLLQGLKARHLTLPAPEIIAGPIRMYENRIIEEQDAPIPERMRRLIHWMKD